VFGFEPTAEQKTLVDSVRRFASRQLRAAAHDADERAELPSALVSLQWNVCVTPLRMWLEFQCNSTS